MRHSGIVLVLVIASASARAEDPAVTAARQRQERIKTLDVTFKRADHVTKGAEAKIIAGAVANRLVLSGQRFRYEDNNPMFRMPEGGLSNHRRLSVTDMKLAKCILFPSGENHPFGFVDGDPRSSHSHDALVTPLLLFCRGTDPGLCAYPIQSFKPTGATSVVAGSECQEYAMKTGDALVHLWVDPKSEHVARRIQDTKKGNVTRQIDISYSGVGGDQLMPTGWAVSHFNLRGKLFATRTGTVAASVVNKPVEASEFTIEFPPSSTYHDRRNGVEYEVDGDGKASVRRRPYRADESGPAQMPWQSVALSVVGLACAIVGGFVLYGRKRPATI